MFIGQPKIMLRDSKGAVTKGGQAWLDMGGRDVVRFQGPIQNTPSTRYVEENGTRHVMQKLVQGTAGPEWQLTNKGKLRFREQNQWEVMIPAILHKKTRRTDLGRRLLTRLSSRTGM